MNRHLNRNALSAACSIAMLGLPTLSNASGFAVPEISIAGLGLSNAIVANKDEVGAVTYNPAIAAMQPGNSLSGGLMLVIPNLETTTATGNHESQGEEAIPIPMGQVTYSVNDKVALALGISAPFGLETSWDASAPGVFPGLVGGGHPTESKIALVDVNPAVAFKLNENVSIAMGADLYWVKEVIFSADIIEIDGDGTGWGWNAALFYDRGPWSFGLSYHSKATVEVEGSSRWTGTGTTGAASADIPIPSRLQAGVRYQFNEQTAAEFDITRTGWSNFDTLTINTGLPGPLPPAINSANSWKDVNAYRLGVSHQLNDKTRLRFGYTFDKTPQPRDHFSARIPDNDRHLFSIGVNHKVDQTLELDAGYMYVKFEDYTHAAPGAGPVAGDPNGSILYNGDYSSNVHLIGVGVSKRF